MIKRYARREMAAIWEEKNRFDIWLKIEVLAAEAMGRAGKVPVDAVRRIKKKASYDISRIGEIEKSVKHDVIAFLTSVSEFIGDDSAYLHQGLTSSDILDTSLAVQLAQASDILISDIEDVVEALKSKALKYKDYHAMGRTHGIHAEPITFGLKLLSWYEEMKRNLARMQEAKAEISYGKMSGAVGTYSTVDPKVEVEVMRKLGLKPEPVSTQVVPRDRHARFFSTLSLIGSSVERFAVEIRHLQRTEVREAEEFFSEGQKGSSAMPHKKNPVLSENISGLVRLLRGYALSSMENVALWHERDISHSSVERVIGPDATIVCDFILRRFLEIVKSLVVNEEQLKENIKKSYNLFYSQRLMIELAGKGLSREKAYELVQRKAMQAWKRKVDFRSIIKRSGEVKKYMTVEELDSLFDIKYYFRNVGHIFRRSTGKK